MRRLTTWFAGNRDERGAVAPMVALLIVVVVAVTAFAVDIGLQRAAARDMQAVADAVALDTARRLPSCDTAALQSVANESLERQGGTIGRSEPLTVTPGHLDPTTKQFVAGSSGGTCTAVRIDAATTVDFAFAPVIGTDSGSSSRFAVGMRDEPSVCFSAGTTALVLDSSGSALGPVLDTILRVNLGVAGYSGLVDLKDVRVPLADLDAALRVGTGQGLVDGGSVSLSGFMLATATVLENQGDAARAAVLRTIAAQVSGLTVDVGDILALDTEGNAGLGAEINTLDLIGSAIVSAAIANGQNAVNVSQLGVAVAGISLADARLVVIEPPQIACGKVGVEARTAQVRLDLRTGVTTPLVSAAQVELGVRVANGTARLSAINCSATNPTVSVSGTTSTATVVGYGGSGSARLNLVQTGLLGFNLGLGLMGTVASGSSSHVFTYPPAPALPGPHTFGSSVNLNLQITPDSLLGLGLLLGAVVNPILGLVNTAVGSLLTQVLDLLGIRLGTMDVSLLGRPSCSGVKLVG